MGTMGPKLNVGTMLDSLPDPFTNRKVRSKVLDGYLKTADKMTIKYNKKEDKYGNPTNHIKSFSLITPCSKTLSTCAMGLIWRKEEADSNS